MRYYKKNLYYKKINKFNMDQVRKRPKIIYSVEDIQKISKPTQDVKKIKEQVSMFISEVQDQFSKIMNKYERQIEELKSQSEAMKKQKMSSEFYSSPRKSMISTNAVSKFISSPNSPILPMSSRSLFKDTAKSNFYKTNNHDSQQLPKWQSAFEIKNIPSKFSSKQDIRNYFPNELINPQNQDNLYENSRMSHHRSKYQRRSEIKKHHEQEIVHFLQQRCKNLDETTNKMMELIGKKNVKNQSEQSQYQQENQNNSSQYHSKQTQLNQSLSQICDSLNNSFVADKARKSKQKIKKAEEQEKKRRSQLQNKNQKIKKQKALKSLLHRLRQNANSVKQPQIVKASKLIPTGQKTVFNPQASNVLRKNSKVMINPVPVHQNSHRKRKTSPTSPSKNPTPILKHSSNILTRSISGISAISFIQ